MIQAIFSFLALTGLLFGATYGAFWIIDNQKVIFPQEKVSIQTIPTQEDTKTFGISSDGGGNENVLLTENQNTQEKTSEKISEDQKRKITILVLNGGAKAGSANSLAKALQEKGFSETTFSNASLYTYKEITIYFKEDEKMATLIGKEIEDTKQYGKVIKLAQAQTVEQKQADIVIIIGG
ncbi:MAG: LytR family transcriptional regulator [Candidatus Moranbacteria bacterium]|nr:LytR family transcriptional regulator [Candidatus Moranbacteria bacterium]